MQGQHQRPYQRPSGLRGLDLNKEPHPEDVDWKRVAYLVISLTGSAFALARFLPYYMRTGEAGYGLLAVVSACLLGAGFLMLGDKLLRSKKCK